MSNLSKLISRVCGATHSNPVKLVPILFLSACTSWASPPQHLRLDKDVVVSFQSSQEASASCSDLHREIRGKKNSNIRACAFRKSAEAEPMVIIPNPCEFEDVYASLLCHELAHINQMAQNEAVDHEGWGAPIQLTKPDKILPTVEKSSLAESKKLVQLRYEDLPNGEAPLPAKRLLPQYPSVEFRQANFRAAEFRDTANLLADVKQIKLRGLSALKPAS